MARKFRMDHLTREQHLDLAGLLEGCQERLNAAARIVKRAPYTDDSLRCMKMIQQRLIDPLSEGWDSRPYDERYDNPYPSIGYSIR